MSLAILHSACAAVPPSVPLATPPDSNAAAAEQNAEGITQYELQRWSVAREHFASAIEADPNLAESHFNLALVLHKLALHAEATTHFRKAAALAPTNRVITQSRVYRDHTTPLSSSYSAGGSEESGYFPFGGMGY
jgi:Tfp pilus assembly protein PilF